MRRLLKFLHTMGAIGMMGAMAALLVTLSFTPEPTSLPEYASIRAAMGGIAERLFLPSMAVVLVSGLVSMAVTPAFHNSGWVWMKLATGIITFEGSLLAVQGPMQREAALSARALAGEIDVGALASSMQAEWGSLWVLLFVAAVNVVLGVWRPKFSRAKKAETARSVG